MESCSKITIFFVLNCLPVNLKIQLCQKLKLFVYYFNSMFENVLQVFFSGWFSPFYTFSKKVDIRREKNFQALVVSCQMFYPTYLFQMLKITGFDAFSNTPINISFASMRGELTKWKNWNENLQIPLEFCVSFWKEYLSNFWQCYVFLVFAQIRFFFFYFGFILFL